MSKRDMIVDKLTAQERVELMGDLWDSLDAAAAAPITDPLAAELDRREKEADSDPDAGRSWPEIRAKLAKKMN